MNSVDVSDQLRNQYRMDHWLRQKKWWWSIWLYGLGALLTNSWKVYGSVMDEAGVPISQRHTHYSFLLSIATAWIDKDEINPRLLKRQRTKHKKQAAHSPGPETPVAPTRVSRRGRSPAPPASAARPTPSPAMDSPSPSKAPRISERSLHPDHGSISCRLNHFDVFHCPDPVDVGRPSCGLHRYLYGRENGQCRDRIVNCSVCNVNLCIPCFRTFHTVRDFSTHEC